MLDPSKIRFSHDSASFKFQESVFGTINDLAQALRASKVRPLDIKPIRLVEREGFLITIDNRRLEAFRRAGIEIPTRMATRREIRNAIRAGKFSAGELGSDTIIIRGEY